ncbi:hypothetical protein C8F04DRAFT_1408174 [Mycena alexandri]|uniref:Uncharacterized protein n=1 Tax=Mycena alexandri TaxID=1745969 RepID=A0AAD6RVH4_9AGAR|nr:hypothetical protein C8F04DRAFT_1408174 [Mycena alexandri]
MKFFSSLLVLGLGLFAAANPVPAESRDAAIAIRDTVPNASVAPLTLYSVFQILNVAVKAITPGLGAIPAGEGPQGQAGEVAPLIEALIVALNNATSQLSALPAGDMGGADADIAGLVEEILDDVNTALNGLVPKLGLDGLLTPLDAALTGLLTTLGGILPGVLALVGGILIPVGGLVGSLLAGLGLATA